MELQAVDRQLAGASRRRSGRCRCAASGTKSSETCDTWSPWLIQTSISSGKPANRSSCAVIVARGPGRTRGPARCRPGRPAPRRPAACRSRCPAPGCPAGRFPDRTCGAPWLVDAGRPAGEDDAPGSQLANALGRDVVPHDLAVDVLLAHAPGDQLGVLRAEIEDQHSFVGDQAGRLGLCCSRGAFHAPRPSSSIPVEHCSRPVPPVFAITKRPVNTTGGEANDYRACRGGRLAGWPKNAVDGIFGLANCQAKASHGSQNHDLRRYFEIASLRARSQLNFSTGC